MADPRAAVEGAMQIAKTVGVPQLIEGVTDGLGRDLREALFPDIASRLDRLSAQAHDDMMQSLIDVARYIIAAVNGLDPSSVKVQGFLNDRACDPAFAARSLRLLSESLRTPSSVRRRMLAMALLNPVPDTEERDEVDAAVERLQPSDVGLLRTLVQHDEDGAGFHVGHPSNDRRGYSDQLAIGRSPFLRMVRASESGKNADSVRVHDCPLSSLMRLRFAECVDVAHAEGMQNLRMTVLRHVHVLPLGRSVLGVLRDERAFMDIDASASAGMAAEGV